MADQRADLVKWMFLFWAGTILPLAGLIIALKNCSITPYVTAWLESPDATR